MSRRAKSASNQNKAANEEVASTSYPLSLENSNDDDPNVAEVRSFGKKIVTKWFNSHSRFLRFINCGSIFSISQVVLSNKGGPKLIHRGYMYTLHKKQPYNIRWRCVSRTMHCRGSLITTTNCTKPRVRMEHNHKPDFEAAQIARKRYLALGKPCVLTSEFVHFRLNVDPLDSDREKIMDEPFRTICRRGGEQEFY